MREILYKILKIINYFVPKSNAIFFIPHGNSRTDNYDVFNWESDNVLCVLNYILKDDRFDNHLFSIVYYDDNKYLRYIEYLKKFRNKKIKLIKPNSVQFVKEYFLSKIILTDSAHVLHRYKIKKQTLICLGYYTPFKDDFGYIKKFSWRQQIQFFKLSNKIIDYYITTSDLSSRIISCDFLLLYSHLKSLGAPRNDIFYRSGSNFKEQISIFLKRKVERIILYTPTFRDYESTLEITNSRNMFGNTDASWEKSLDDYLNKNNIVLIAKLHPLQERSVVKQESFKNIIYYSDLASKIDVNLYVIMSETDCLITDYTSTSFDYMHKDSPIIYYFYDYEKYVSTRNFSITPIFPLCGGDIAYTKEELFDTIVRVMRGIDAYCSKRISVHGLMNRNRDGKDTERVVNFIFENLKKCSKLD